MQVVKQAFNKLIHKILQSEFQQFYKRRTISVIIDPAANIKPKIHIPGQHDWY